MNFTTQVPIAKSQNPIDYHSKVLLMGSCFSENIGNKFSYFKFQNIVNPFGIIFNPVSIEKLISRAVKNQYFTKADIFFHNERWHCYEVHSDLSQENKEVFLSSLNAILETTKSQITESTHVIITYGTSWVYRNKTSGEIVANCHKVPQCEFEKEILSVETIEKSIQSTIDLFRKINPDCHVVFTISPVRHIKDGFVENQRSKAHLITAIQNVVAMNLAKCHYFPSYEIQMDELRDYRFYAEDMLHPNQVAIDYIWERFMQTAIAENCYSVMEEVSSIQKGLAHRPFNPHSESHRKFARNLQEKISFLQKSVPNIVF